jgi:hypothetical protein
MNKQLILASLLMMSLPLVQAQEIRQVLFLGNSYTYVNDLPKTIHDIAKAMGDSVFYDSNTPGGYTLEGHSTNATSIAKINSRAWDYVVLQEQSQIPSFHQSQVATECYPFAYKLDSMIMANDSCTETVFYMTWGRKNGDQTNCATWPPVCTYEGMQEQLRKSYLKMGVDNSATVAPAGMAWYMTRLINPVFELYQPDESHPGVYGTYLTACVFYATLFHRSPEGCSFISTLPAGDALALQQIAAATVLDSLDQWAGPGDKAYARFHYSVNGVMVQFTDSSLNSTSHQWNFGDGQTSMLTNPSHIYSAAGTYNIELVAANDCLSDTTTKTVVINPVGILMNDEQRMTSVHPNPSDGIFYYSVPEHAGRQKIKICNATGNTIKEVYTSGGNDGMIDLQSYPVGTYFLSVQSEDGVIHYRLIKN